jgi:hypothetical protein
VGRVQRSAPADLLVIGAMAIRAAFIPASFCASRRTLPVVVEIIDSQEKIERFLPVLDGMMASGLITMERAEVLQYGAEEAGSFKSSSESRIPLT